MNTYAHSEDHLSSLIQRYDCFSFDIFDTVLLRLVPKPSDIFSIVQTHLPSSLKEKVVNFRNLRALAEYETRQIMFAKLGNEEVTISQIYKRLSDITLLSKEESQSILNLELEVEANFLISRGIMKDFYDKLVSYNKSIVFTSDIYFDDAFLFRVLEKNGFYNPTIFSSSNHLKTKSENGRLFEVVLDNVEFHTSRILHIGDNISSDIRSGLAKGLNVIHIPKTSDIYRESLTNSRNLSLNIDTSSENVQIINLVTKSLVMHGVEKCKAKTFTSPIQSIGYSILGPLWVDYAHWIQSQCNKLGIKKLFFLSRDGYPLKESCQLLLADKNELIKNSSYLYLSRLVLYKAYLFKSKDPYPYFLQNYTDRPLSKLIERFCGNIVPFEALTFKSSNVEKLNCIPRKDLSYKESCIIIDEALSQLMPEFEVAYNNLKKYLNQSQFFLEDKVGIVDLGWHGSLQFLLQELCSMFNEENINIHGFYHSIFNHDKVHENNYSAYITSPAHNSDYVEHVRNSASLLEVLHSAPHGTLLGYEKSKNDDTLNPVLESRKDEIAQYNLVIKKIHDSAYSFIVDWMSTVEKNDFIVDNNKCYTYDPFFVDSIMRLVLEPNSDEFRLLSRLGLAPDFGIHSPLSTFSSNKDLWKTN